MTTKRIYIICPVRNVKPEQLALMRAYVRGLKHLGYTVHFPPDDVNQDDPSGREIVRHHYAAMTAADEVHVFWDKASGGSHWDAGMAYALGKRFVPVHNFHSDNYGKSYWKVMGGYANT